jgi:hypothetical protein
MNEKTIDQIEKDVLSYEVADEAVEAPGRGLRSRRVSAHWRAFDRPAHRSDRGPRAAPAAPSPVRKLLDPLLQRHRERLGHQDRDQSAIDGEFDGSAHAHGWGLSPWAAPAG